MFTKEDPASPPRVEPVGRVRRAHGEFRVFLVDRRRELELRGRDRADVDRLAGDPTLPPSLDVWSARAQRLGPDRAVVGAPRSSNSAASKRVWIPNDWRPKSQTWSRACSQPRQER